MTGKADSGRELESRRLRQRLQGEEKAAEKERGTCEENEGKRCAEHVSDNGSGDERVTVRHGNVVRERATRYEEGSCEEISWSAKGVLRWCSIQIVGKTLWQRPVTGAVSCPAAAPHLPSRLPRSCFLMMRMLLLSTPLSLNARSLPSFAPHARTRGVRHAKPAFERLCFSLCFPAAADALLSPAHAKVHVHFLPTRSLSHSRCRRPHHYDHQDCRRFLLPCCCCCCYTSDLSIFDFWAPRSSNMTSGIRASKAEKSKYMFLFHGTHVNSRLDHRDAKGRVHENCHNLSSGTS